MGRVMVACLVLTGCGGVDLSGFQGAAALTKQEGYPCLTESIVVCAPGEPRTVFICDRGQWVVWGKCQYVCDKGLCVKEK